MFVEKRYESCKLKGKFVKITTGKYIKDTLYLSKNQKFGYKHQKENISKSYNSHYFTQ